MTDGAATPGRAAAAGPAKMDAPGGRIGVLLVNLGTPEGTDYRSMRRYLREFLSDRRVIEVPRLVWWPVLHGLILSLRPLRSAAKYRAIWNEALNESPLRTITRAQGEKLAAALAGAGADISVDWAMRYGAPSIGSRLAALRERGCDRILLVPLYPQYSATTTATANDAAFDALKRMRRQPAIRTVPAYYDEPVYIAALADSIGAALSGLDFEPEVLLVSFHGLPKSFIERGDPYYRQCLTTARCLREALGWPEERWRVAFQSRVGPAEWLQPHTDETIDGLARQGVRRIAVAMPGFSADCLETLEEIAIENAAIFRAAGGERFFAVPCLNDSPEGMRVIETIVRRELSGWIGEDGSDER